MKLSALSCVLGILLLSPAVSARAGTDTPKKPKQANLCAKSKEHASTTCGAFTEKNRAPANFASVRMDTDADDFHAPIEADEAAELGRPAGSILNIEAP